MRRRMRRRMIIGGMVVLGVGYGAYKLTQSQVQQVEQKTGKKAEDLSEEELEGAMDELGIEAQEPTDEEIAMLEAGNEPDENLQPRQPHKEQKMKNLPPRQPHKEQQMSHTSTNWND